MAWRNLELQLQLSEAIRYGTEVAPYGAYPPDKLVAEWKDRMWHLAPRWMGECEDAITAAEAAVIAGWELSPRVGRNRLRIDHVLRKAVLERFGEAMPWLKPEYSMKYQIPSWDQFKQIEAWLGDFDFDFEIMEGIVALASRLCKQTYYGE